MQTHKNNTETSTTRDCKHTKPTRRPARPWIAAHKRNTQTSRTVDCKHTNNTTQTSTTLDCKHIERRVCLEPSIRSKQQMLQPFPERQRLQWCKWNQTWSTNKLFLNKISTPIIPLVLWWSPNVIASTFGTPTFELLKAKNLSNKKTNQCTVWPGLLPIDAPAVRPLGLVNLRRARSVPALSYASGFQLQIVLPILLLSTANATIRCLIHHRFNPDMFSHSSCIVELLPSANLGKGCCSGTKQNY